MQNGANIAFTVPANDMEVEFQWNSVTKELRIIVGGIQGDLTKAQAYWLSADTIAWNVPTDTTVALFADPEGALTLDGPGIVVGPESRSWTLTHDPAGLSPALKARFPHLANLAAFKLPADAIAAAAQSLKGQLAVGAVRSGHGVDATALQIPGVLDDLYAAKAAPLTLGPSFSKGQTTLRVWAPTARDLKLRLFADSNPGTMFSTHDMTLDAASGVWSYTAPTAALLGKYYLYEARVFVRANNRVETNIVTDPYSVSLARNSTRSQIVSLDDPHLQPHHWTKLRKPFLAAPEDMVLYELHVRDFSATDQTVPAALRGTYSAFTQKRSDGMRHLTTAGPGRRHARTPAAIVRLRDHQRGQVHLAIAVVRRAGGLSRGFSRTAGTGRGDCRSGRLQLGLRPAALQRARGQLCHGCRRVGAHPRVPRDGAVAEPERPARGDGRGLQPHQFFRTESELHSRQAGARAITTGSTATATCSARAAAPTPPRNTP